MGDKNVLKKCNILTFGDTFAGRITSTNKNAPVWLLGASPTLSPEPVGVHDD